MDFLFIIVILIMSVVVHEVAHGFAALWLGDPTAKYEGRLTLNPISHLDLVGSVIVPLIGYFAGGIIIGWAKPVPFNPYNLRNARWGEALVAVAGPASNILLALIFAAIIRASFIYDFATESFLFLAGYLIMINIVLALFNLAPIPPLDGSKILFSLFPTKLLGLRRRLEQSGLFLVLIFIFFFSQFLAPVASWVFGLLVGNLSV